MAQKQIFGCSCGGEFLPYYDNEEDKIIFMYRCKNCGIIMWK
jgi:hypothetical protein